MAHRLPLGEQPVERERDGCVAPVEQPVDAFQGLSLRPTQHVVELDGRTLYAWCAGDTLLIHDFLRRPVRVRSTDPITGRTVSLSVEDGSVADLRPPTAVLSMLRPHAPMGDWIGDDVVPDACGPINFFGSEETGHEFTERVEGTFLLTLEEGLELVRLINEAVLGSALADDAH